MKNILLVFVLLAFTAFAQAQTDADPFHPMDALTPAEINNAVKLLKAAGDADKDTTYPAVTLREAPKDFIQSWKKGTPFSRAAFVILRKQNRTFEAVVDLTAKKVTTFVEKPGAGAPASLSQTAGAVDATGVFHQVASATSSCERVSSAISSSIDQRLPRGLDVTGKEQITPKVDKKRSVDKHRDVFG